MISFSDLNKDKIDCYVANPKKGSHCFWDRHPLKDTVAVVCPTRFKPKQVVKVYKSEISKDVYTIKENITSDTNPVNFDTLNEEYETDGLFCSLNCCLAFIKDNKHNLQYSQSEMLFYKLVNYERVLEAPHWRTLIEYGGTLTIKEFRKGLFLYAPQGQTLESVDGKAKGLCYLYTKTLKLN